MWLVVAVLAVTLAERLTAVWAWMLDNPLATLAIGSWLIANVAPRPHPSKMTGWKKVFWSAIDRVCVLTATALPGRFKWIFALSPEKPTKSKPAKPKAPPKSQPPKAPDPDPKPRSGEP